MDKLKMKSGNTKLDVFTYVFDLPAGHTCPGANICKSICDKETGKISDCGETKFRCYAASLEWLNPVRELRWHNFDLLRGQTTNKMVAIIIASMYEHIEDVECRSRKMNNFIKRFPEKVNEPVRFRIHSSGDFFSQNYFNAWLEVAKLFPKIIFYAYTKSINFVVERINDIPSNFKITASMGGKFDNLIKEYNLKYSDVVFSEEEARERGLTIDHDDSLGWKYDKSFALLLHGTQPAGSLASVANQKLRKAKKNGYRMKIKTSKKK